MRPAERLGVPIDTEVVEEILIPRLTDESEHEIDLPMLQIVCDAWHRQAEDTAPAPLAEQEPQPQEIGADALGRLGDLPTVLERYLDETLQQFQEPEQTREVLKALVSSEESGGVVKRALFLEELLSRLHTAQVSLTPETLEQRILRHLVQARLVRATKMESGTRYELSHDFLATRIADWIETHERERTKVLEMIERAYEVYRAT